MAKTMYHGELRQLGPVQVTVKTPWTESTKKKGTYYTTLIVNGAERYYNPENQACLEFWAGKQGQTITIVADGSREEATIVQMQTGAQVPQPAAAPAGQPPRPVQPPQPAGGSIHPPGATNAPNQAPAPGRQPTASHQPGPARPTREDPRQNGQRVGMAINQAVLYACHSGEVWNPKAIYERASDLMRIAHQLEGGQLAPKFSERAAKPQEAGE